MTGSLKRRAVLGVLWTVFGFGASQVLRLGFNLVATRLLYPEMFGLLALVHTIATGLALFCDVGIAPAIVQDPRGAEPAFLNTAWTLQIVRGIGISLTCLLLAWPVSQFYSDARLRWILPMIGLGYALSGFNSTSLLTFTRTLEVRQKVILEAVAQLLSGSVMVIWAWLSPTVWALIAGPTVWSAVRMAWSHFLIPGRRDRFAWEPAAVQALWRFGRWVWIASLLTFLAAQSDRLILGKILTLQMLGVYGLAASMSELPRSLALSVGSNVIFPASAQLAILPRPELRARILRHRWGLLLAMAGVVTVLTVGGDILMRVLYDKRYAAAAWMLPVLAFGIWPSALASTMDPSLLAIGQPRYAASANLLKIVFTAAGIPLAFHWLGVGGAVIVVALNDLPYYGRICHALWREGLSSWRQDLAATGVLAAMLGIALAVRSALGFGLPIRGMF
jgi:O-antigen/teichoic acid export membrane protein